MIDSVWNLFLLLCRKLNAVENHRAQRREETGFYFVVCEYVSKYITRVRPSKRIVDLWLGYQDFLLGRDRFFRVFQFLHRFCGQERLRHLAIGPRVTGERVPRAIEKRFDVIAPVCASHSADVLPYYFPQAASRRQTDAEILMGQWPSREENQGTGMLGGDVPLEVSVSCMHLTSSLVSGLPQSILAGDRSYNSNLPMCN